MFPAIKTHGTIKTPAIIQSPKCTALPIKTNQEESIASHAEKINFATSAISVPKLENTEAIICAM